MNEQRCVRWRQPKAAKQRLAARLHMKTPVSASDLWKSGDLLFGTFTSPVSDPRLMTEEGVGLMRLFRPLGGVFTVAGIADSTVFHTAKLFKKVELGKQY